MSDFESKHPRNKAGQFVDKHQSVTPNIKLGDDKRYWGVSEWDNLSLETQKTLRRYGFVDVGWNANDFINENYYDPEYDANVRITKTPTFLTEDGELVTLNDLSRDELEEMISESNISDAIEQRCEEYRARNVSVWELNYFYEIYENVEDFIKDTDVIERLSKKPLEELNADISQGEKINLISAGQKRDVDSLFSDEDPKVRLAVAKKLVEDFQRNRYTGNWKYEHQIWDMEYDEDPLVQEYIKQNNPYRRD